jgi:phosphatidylglycerophosphate synthase
MAHTTRFAALSLLVLLASLLALPAMAAESGTEAGDSDLPAEVIDEGETTGTTEAVTFEYLPAVVIEQPPAELVEQPWTTKFLVPTGLALAAVAVFVTVIQYFVRVVRSRYKVVE